MSETPMSRVTIFLIVSLVVNALLIGFILGGGIGKHHGEDRAGGARGPIGEMGLARGIERSVPNEQRSEVRKAFRRAFLDTRTQRRAVREARQDLARLMGSEKYDQAAIEEAFSKLRQAEADSRARLHTELSKQFSNLSLDDRRAILKELSRRGERMPRSEGREPPPRP